MTRRAPGRRSSCTPDVRWLICDHVRKGHTMSAAARAAGISPRTLQRWLEEGRKHRKGKFRRLVADVEKARSELLETLDSVEYDIAIDRSLPASVRLAAVRQIRTRVFAHLVASPATTVDVYHHHSLDLQPQDSRDEVPPESMLTDRELIAASDAELDELREALIKVRGTLPGAPWPDVIDSESVA